MTDVRWARLETDGNFPLRRGAWYRVADLSSSEAMLDVNLQHVPVAREYRVAHLSPSEAMLDVNRQHVPVPRASVKIVTAPPQYWTVVPRPPDDRPIQI